MTEVCTSRFLAILTGECTQESKIRASSSAKGISRRDAGTLGLQDQCRRLSSAPRPLICASSTVLPPPPAGNWLLAFAFAF